VLAGNNEKKTEYILKALEAGLNVLADKPMAITPEDFELLKKAFDVAKEKNLLLYLKTVELQEEQNKLLLILVH